MKFKLLAFFTTLTLLSNLLTSEKKEALSDYDPWYTGPLIAIAADNVPPGQVNINPYLIVNNIYGQYNNHWNGNSTSNLTQINNLWIIEYGITELFDIVIQPSATCNIKKGSHYTGLEDLGFRVNFQLSTEIPGTMQPSLRFMFRQHFPIGAYDQFNPLKHGTESLGQGCFETTLGLNLGKIVYWLKAHPIRWRVNLAYSFPTTVHVEGFNAYGGGYNTYGTAHPGNTFNLVTSHEFSLNQRWVLALELQYRHYRKSSFHGILGTDLAGNTATMGSASGDNFILAPCVEYNFTKDLGVYAGVEVTFLGRNTNQMVSPNLALTYTW